MTSFGWKKKSGERVSRTASAAFEENAFDEEEADELMLGEGEIDWLSLQQAAKRTKAIPLEDSIVKATRLKSEGAVLAEQERFWEALKKWDASLDLNPNDETVYEMKSQAYMALSEVHPALTAARKAVEMNPRWWIGYQTLGRAHLGLGEVKTAILQFSRAVHINPAQTELWEEDLKWAHNLWLQKQTMVKQKEASETENLESTEGSSSSVKITEIDSDTNIQECEPISGVTNQDINYKRKRDSLTDKDLITSTSRSKRSSNEGTDDKISHVPNGYIKMRDVT